METNQKIKNVHDLEYNTLLNYQNIILVILGTIAITLWFKDIPLENAHSIKLLATSGIFLLGIVATMLFSAKREDIKNNILKL